MHRRQAWFLQTTAYFVLWVTGKEKHKNSVLRLKKKHLEAKQWAFEFSLEEDNRIWACLKKVIRNETCSSDHKMQISADECEKCVSSWEEMRRELVKVFRSEGDVLLGVWSRWEPHQDLLFCADDQICVKHTMRALCADCFCRKLLPN